MAKLLLLLFFLSVLFHVPCNGSENLQESKQVDHVEMQGYFEGQSGYLAQHYIGCFINDGNIYSASVDLEFPLRGGDNRNINFCRNSCARKSFKYFGIQQTACICGNRYNSQEKFYLRPNTECGVINGIGFGGGGRTAVYAVEMQVAVEERKKSLANLYIGCFTDGGDGNRDLPFLMWSANLEVYSPSSCLAKCDGFKYFAIQSSICFCGDAFGTNEKVHQLRPNAECGITNGVGFGGGYRNAIYATSQAEAVKARAPITEIQQSYLGCFADNGNRDLQIIGSGFPFNAHFYCRTQCKANGFSFFALQDDSACTCGNSYGPAHDKAYVRVLDSDCRVINGLGFGGGWRNAIYSVTPSASYQVDAYDDDLLLPSQYIGCFLDRQFRSISDLEHRSDRQVSSLSQCRSYCVSLKFVLFGVSNAYCNCGNTFNKYPENYMRPDIECGIIHGARGMGADWRHAIYGVTLAIAQNMRATHDSLRKSYIGCFIDSPRIVTFFSNAVPFNNLAGCRDKCAKDGKPLFILQNQYCACGDVSMFQDGRHWWMRDDHCGVGTSQGVGFGGNNRNAVYSSDPNARDAIGARYDAIRNSYLGCYVEDGNLANAQFKFIAGTGWPSVDPINCKTLCANAKYTYFSLLNGYGGQCRCSNEYGPTLKDSRFVLDTDSFCEVDNGFGHGGMF